MQPADRTAVWMTKVYTEALASKDTRTKVGALIVGPDGETRSMGYNGFARDSDDYNAFRHVSPEKQYWVVHAEENAIYNAAAEGIATRGCTMITQGMPCDLKCGKAIVQARIATVIIHKEWNDENPHRYERTRELFRETCVTLIEWSGEILKPIGWADGAVRPAERVAA